MTDTTTHEADLRVTRVRVQALEAELTAARAELGATILAARAAGMTVPHCAEVLDLSQSEVFRISAKAKLAN